MSIFYRMETTVFILLASVLVGCGDVTNPLGVMNSAVDRNPDAENVIDCMTEFPEVTTWNSLNQVDVDLTFDKECLEGININEETEETGDEGQGTEDEAGGAEDD